MEGDKDGVVGAPLRFINGEESFFFWEQSGAPFPNQPSLYEGFPS